MSIASLLQRTLLNLCYFLARARRQTRSEIINQHRNVIDAFTQSRHVNRENVEPIKKVHAESTFVDFSSQIFIGCHDHAHVGLNRAVATNALELFLLQDAQQRYLNLGTKFGDLIKKDRPAVSSFESPDALLHSAPVNAPFS